MQSASKWLKLQTLTVPAQTLYMHGEMGNPTHPQRKKQTQTTKKSHNQKAKQNQTKPKHKTTTPSQSLALHY